MAKNKITTSQGNVQFTNAKGRTINMHPMHCYAVYENDTVSFLFIYMKEYSGQAFFSSQFEDLEVNGESYGSLDELKDAINYAFAKAGAQARTEIVEELPEDPFTNTIYLIKKEHGEGYDEYIWNEDEGWQLIGDTDIEFERYLKIDDFNPYSAATKEYIDSVSANTVQNASDIQFLSGAVDTEISNREAADAVISGAVDTLSTNLSNEVQRAQNAEQTLQNNINTANARIDAEQIARANADNAISGAVDSVTSDLASEVSRATAKENEIDSKVDGEISNREAADTAISGAVDSLSANLSLEVQRAQNAESALNTKVNALSGEVETMGDEAIVDAAYVSSSTTIDFYNADGAVVAQVDATDFVKDGMIEDVRIENGYLIIDFNTESGIQDIQIPLTDIFDPDNYYDKTAVDGLLADKADLSALTEDERVLGEALNDLNSRVDTISGDVADKASQSAVDTVSANLATEAQRAQDAEDALSGAIDTKLAISDFNTYSGNVETELGAKANSADVYSKSEVYTKAEVDEAIAEIDLSDYYTKVETDGKLADKADVTALTQVNNALVSHTENTNVHVTSAEKETWSGKQDTLIAGENITISGNVISSSGGVDSGAVESIIEDYMTAEVAEKLFDTKFIYANDAPFYTGNGFKRFNVQFADEFNKKGRFIPYNKYSRSDKIMVNGKTTFFIINSEYVNAIPSTLKDSTNRWIKINQLIDKPTKATDLIPSWRHNAGAIESNNVAWSEVSGDTYYCLAQNAGVWDLEYTSDYDFNFNSYPNNNQYAIVLTGKESDKLSFQKLLGEYIFYYSNGNEGYFSPVIANFSGTTTGTYDSSNKYIDGKVNDMVDKTYVVEDFIYTQGNGIKITNNTISVDLPLSRGNGSDSLKESEASQANGRSSHAEGGSTRAIGEFSHAEGYNTSASGYCSHAEGGVTKATNEYEHASGRDNISSKASTLFGDSGNTLFSVGNGAYESLKHNAFEIRQNGDIYVPNTDDTSVTGADAYSLYPMVRLQDTITALGGLKLVKLTQSEYDALATKDSNTLYIISD